MKYVEIFKTYVNHVHQAEHLCSILSQKLEDTKVNFDLDDCDKVLRVESFRIDSIKIINIMETLGYSCELIPGGGLPEGC